MKASFFFILVASVAGPFQTSASVILERLLATDLIAIGYAGHTFSRTSVYTAARMMHSFTLLEQPVVLEVPPLFTRRLHLCRR